MLSRTIPLTALLLTFLIPLGLHAQETEWGSGINMRPDAPRAGEKVTFLLTVKAGSKGASNIVVRGGIDGDNSFSHRIPELRPNRSKRIRFAWVATAGRHTASFSLGPVSARRTTTSQRITHSFEVKAAAKATLQQRIAPPLPRSRAHQLERSRTAPAISTTLSPQQAAQQPMRQPTCSGNPLPDLIISSVSVSGNGYPNNPHSINVTVQNRGQCDSGIFAVRVEVLEQVPARGIHRTREVGNKGYPSLSPCRSESCSEASHSMSFDYTLLPDYHAYYDFSVEVDSSNGVEEFNEDNNSRYRTEGIEVKGPEYYGQ